MAYNLSVYKIVQSPNEILRKNGQTTNLPIDKLKKIVAEMCETLLSQKDPEGVGLAANQVGLPFKIFLARFTVKNAEPVRVFINPEILSHSEELQNTPQDRHAPLEGCLSLPKYYGVVERWKWVKLEYQCPRHSGEAGRSRADSRIDSGPALPAGRRGQNDIFETKIEKFTGFPAVVIQHEMDHLNGKIFVERILEQQGKLYKINGKDKKGKETWEEVSLE